MTFTTTRHKELMQDLMLGFAEIDVLNNVFPNMQIALETLSSTDESLNLVCEFALEYQKSGTEAINNGWNESDFYSEFRDQYLTLYASKG